MKYQCVAILTSDDRLIFIAFNKCALFRAKQVLQAQVYHQIGYRSKNEQERYKINLNVAKLCDHITITS